MGVLCVCVCVVRVIPVLKNPPSLSITPLNGLHPSPHASTIPLMAPPDSPVKEMFSAGETITPIRGVVGVVVSGGGGGWLLVVVVVVGGGGGGRVLVVGGGWSGVGCC